MFDIDQSGPVATMRFGDVGSGWEQWGLLRSDVHHDSVHCKRGLEKRHLDLAKERGAFIMDFGDTFDAMQGKYDPRKSYDEIRPEYLGEDYYDLLVDDLSKFYKPYADNFALMGLGNHESSVERKANTNLAKRLSNEIGCIYGNWGGYVRFMFTMQKTQKSTLRMRYSHSGGGGSAPVTRGVISTNRQAVWISRADIVVNGHDHNGWVVPIKREELNNKGKTTYPICWFLRIPGYHDGWNEGKSGWNAERNGGPRVHGSIWVRFYYYGGEIVKEFTQSFE